MRATAIKNGMKLALAGFALLCPLSAGAATTHYVSLAGQHVYPFTNWFYSATNIQAAVDASTAGDEVLVSNGVYRLNAQISITQGVHVIGYGGSEATTVDGGSVTRCFQIAGSGAVVEGFTITAGHADTGAGVLCTTGMLLNSVIVSNSAVGTYSPTGGVGGGVYCGVEGTISNCLVAYNTASNLAGGNGAGIFCSGGRVQRSIIQHNATADQGGGGGLFVGYGGIVEDCIVTANRACGGAGVLCVSTGILRRCTVSSNQTIGASFPVGGGVLAAWDSIVQASIIENNIASLYGGGIVAWDSSVTDSRIQGNVANDAAGVLLVQGDWMALQSQSAISSARVDNCQIILNYASTNGGGVYAVGGSLHDCTISNNSAGVAGGGLFAISNAVVRDCRLLQNTAVQAGGGGYSDRCSFFDSLFLANSASCGGGLFDGPNTNIIESVSNLLGMVDLLSNVVIQLYAVGSNLTALVSQLPDGLGGSPSPAGVGASSQPPAPTVHPATSPLPPVSLPNVFSHTVPQANGIALLGTQDLLVSNCLFTGNTAQFGGGLCMGNGGEIHDTAFYQNDADSVGGAAIAVSAGVFQNCNFTSNTTGIAGGGVMLAGGLSSGTITSTVPLAVSLDDTALMQVRNSQFIQNSAGTTGGGMMLGGESLAESNVVNRNIAPWGGGIANWGGDVRNATVTSNAASFGGGVFALGGSVSGCTLQHNEAAWMGGGAIAFSAPTSVTIGQCMLAGNAAFAGGGIAFADSVQVEACRLTDNTAARAGGGMFCVYGGELRSSLVSGNVATDGGGAYYLDGGRLINSTLIGNCATNTGGGICIVTNVPGGPPSPRTATIRNSIIYANTAVNGVNFFNLGTNVSYSYCCTIPEPEIGGEGNITNAPQLTPSGWLKSTSPCIDAGTALEAPPTDIDGEARWDHPGHSNVVSIVDIGADEFVDTDLDNMADYWETEAFGSVTNRDGTTDADSDTLNDLDEYENSTTPTNPDTDADEMPDGWEVSHTLNPLADDAQGDPDSDNMRNVGEYVSDTDPHDADSVLSLIRVDRQFGGIRLDWKGGCEAWQILECRENLASTTEQWTAIFALPPPTATTNAVIDMGATNPALFYRIRAERW